MNVMTKLAPITSNNIANVKRLSCEKKVATRGSSCMYPIEYKWISEPMPVTISIIVSESASIWKANGTCIPPILIQSKSLTMCVAPSTGCS